MGSPSSIHEDLIVGGNLRVGGSISPLMTRSNVLNQSPLQAFTVPLSRFRDHGHDAMIPGTGISTGTGTICENHISRSGGLIKTEILLDLTGLNDGDTLGDVIGKDADTANCHIGRITAAVNGTIIAGRIHCLEVPAGGDVDVDLWGSVDEATLAQDTAITAAAGEEQITDHGDWAANEIDEFNNLPDADGYLYLVTGAQGSDADYTGGIFLIEMWGTPAAIDYIGGTYGTNTPTLQSPDVGANGAATNYYARGEIQLPWEYEAGQSVTIRLRAGMITAVADQSATVDIEVYESTLTGAGVDGSDICLTAATSDNMNNEAFQQVDFVITPTDLSPGDLLDVRIKMTLDDNATAVTKGAIGLVQLLCDVR